MGLGVEGGVMWLIRVEGVLCVFEFGGALV